MNSKDKKKELRKITAAGVSIMTDFFREMLSIVFLYFFGKQS